MLRDDKEDPPETGGVGRLRRWAATAIGVVAAVATGWLMVAYWNPTGPECGGSGLGFGESSVAQCNGGEWIRLADQGTLAALAAPPVEVEGATTIAGAGSEDPPEPRTGVSVQNLVANPSLEDVVPLDSTPAQWLPIQFGVNVVELTSSEESHDGRRSARTEITQWKDGGAAWSFAAVPIAPGQSFRYSEWYRSSIPGEVGAVFTIGSGSDAHDEFVFVGEPEAADEWTQFSKVVTAPPGATSVSVYHSIAGVGWVEVDDVGLVPAQPLERPIISLTFDDRDAAHADIAGPELAERGLRATFFVTSGLVSLGPSGRMTNAQVRLLAAAGHQIGSHTVDHPDLVADDLSTAALRTQLDDSRATLQVLTGQPVDDFAAPFGATNLAIRREIMATYRSHRTVESGTNGLFTTDVTQLRSHLIGPSTTPTEIRSLIEQARTEQSWLILTFHDIIPDIDPSDRFSVTPKRFEEILDEVARSGLAVRTLAEARTEVQAQLDAAGG